MDFWKSFSQSDLFNYYLAGTVWGLDIILIVTISASESIITKPFLTQNINAPGVAVIGILIVVLPYLLGFIMTPIGNWITKKCRPEYQKLALELGTGKSKSKPLPKTMVNAIEKKAEILFGPLHDKSLYFYWIRAYVWQIGGPAVDLAMRAQALSNLTESLLISVPMTGLLFTLWLFINYFGCSIWYAAMTGLLLVIILYKLLWNRYLTLREYFVKHVYRAFLVIEAIRNQSKL